MVHQEFNERLLLFSLERMNSGHLVGAEFAGRIRDQEFYENSLLISLEGMNIGHFTGVHNFNNSGEAYVLSFIKNNQNTLNTPLVIFDVGANIGRYTQLVLDIFKNNDVRIFAFEPSLKTFKELKKNFLKI